jgi:hypothetical protein
MMQPGPRLRALIIRATPAQNARASKRAQEHRRACWFFGIEPATAETVLAEALEVIFAEDAGVQEEAPQPAPYDVRNYAGSYSER